MDILLRDIPKSTVLKIDELSRKSGMSRNTFLNKHIEQIAQSPELIKLSGNYAELVDLVCAQLRKNEVILKECVQKNEETIHYCINSLEEKGL